MPPPALLGLAALLLEIASKPSGSQSNSDHIRDTAPLAAGRRAARDVGKKVGAHTEREVSR